MNKWLWAIPIGVIVVAAVTVALLGGRDVEPDEMIYATALEEAVEVTETDALLLLDRARAAFDDCFSAFASGGAYALPEGVLRADADGETLYLVVEERPGVRVAVARGDGVPAAADSLGGPGYNVVRYRNELIGEWVYYAEYVQDLTFRDTYEKRLDAGLTDADKAKLAEDAIKNAALVLMDADQAPAPADRSSSRYVICAQLECADGGVMTAVLDPREKTFLGVAAET